MSPPPAAQPCLESLNVTARKELVAPEARCSHVLPPSVLTHIAPLPSSASNPERPPTAQIVDFELTASTAGVVDDPELIVVAEVCKGRETGAVVVVVVPPLQPARRNTRARNTPGTNSSNLGGRPGGEPSWRYPHGNRRFGADILPPSNPAGQHREANLLLDRIIFNIAPTVRGGMPTACH